MSAQQLTFFWSFNLISISREVAYLLIRKVQVVSYLTKNRNGWIPFHFGRFGFGLSSLIPMNRLTHGPGSEKAPTIWTNHKWNAEYCEGASRLRAFVPETGAKPVGWAYPEQLGLSSTACGLVWGIPFVHVQMGSRSFTELRVCRLWANRRPCSNNVPYTSGTTWNTRSDVLDDETWSWLNNTTASIWFRQCSSLE